MAYVQWARDSYVHAVKIGGGTPALALLKSTGTCTAATGLGEGVVQGSQSSKSAKTELPEIIIVLVP